LDAIVVNLVSNIVHLIHLSPLRGFNKYHHSTSGCGK